MCRTRFPRVGPESASLQAVRSWCSSDKGLMGSKVMRAGESNCVKGYKRLEEIAKLATSYLREHFFCGDRAEIGRNRPFSLRPHCPTLWGGVLAAERRM